MTESLGTELPKEIDRVYNVVMPQYLSIGPAGSFALACMRRDLNLATKAIMEGDLPAMISAYKALKDYKS